MHAKKKYLFKYNCLLVNQWHDKIIKVFTANNRTNVVVIPSTKPTNSLQCTVRAKKFPTKLVYNISDAIFMQPSPWSLARTLQPIVCLIISSIQLKTYTTFILTVIGCHGCKFFGCCSFKTLLLVDHHCFAVTC